MKAATHFALLAFLALAAPRASSQLQSAKLVAGDAGFRQFFGFSVSIHGSTALVGAPDADGVSTASGAAYVYDLQGSSWVQTAKLLPSDGATGDNFGFSVAIDGTTALVGAHENNGLATSAGAVFVFELQGASWVETAKLLASDGGAHDDFGYSVAISGDRAVVLGWGTAFVYVFERQGTTWAETGKLLGSDVPLTGSAGWSVAVSGGHVVVGSPNDGDRGYSAGAAYAFELQGTGWVQTAKLYASDAAASDYFGRRVSVFGTTAVIGAYLNDDLGSASGSAYVFDRQATGWTETTKLLPADGAAGDSFGHSVAISGTTAVVGAPGDSDTATSAGSAYTFELQGAGWVETAKLLASDGGSGDDFGDAVALSGSTALIGARHDDDLVLDSGSAYVFVVNLPLLADVDQVSLSAGGVQTLNLTLDSSQAGKSYQVLGSVSGDSPGVSYSGTPVPLNADPYMVFTLLNPNSPPLANSAGQLDSSASATITFTIPPLTDPSLAGLTVHHAGFSLDLVGGYIVLPQVTNAVPVTLVP